jgi:hypothetical protein
MTYEPGHATDPTDPTDRTYRTDLAAPAALAAPPARTVRSTEPPLSWEGLVALACAGLTLLVLLVDAYVLSKTKHVICDKWLARGQADCGGGDGFREWFPALLKQGGLLLIVEVIVVPAAVYGFARLFRRERSGHAEA